MPSPRTVAAAAISPPPPRRAKETVLPSYDPDALAADLEASGERPTSPPPFDPQSYARIVDDRVESAGSGRAPSRGESAVPESLAEGTATESETTTTIGRAMYGSYLSSDYPEALVLAERVLDREPGHALARLVMDACHTRLGPTTDARRLMPSSVVRLKRHRQESGSAPPDRTSQIVLGHVDGVADIAMLADLAGISRPEALDRLHALVEAGLLEVVNE